MKSGRQESSGDAPMGRQAPATATILVIDEQLLVSSALAHTLRGQGFDAHSLRITDLAGVLSAALAHRPGLVLLDLDLRFAPDGRPISGVDLVAPLHAQGWTVLVITGAASLDRATDAVALGAASWIAKGATFAELVHAAVKIMHEGRLLLPLHPASLIERQHTVQVSEPENDLRLRSGTCPDLFWEPLHAGGPLGRNC